MAEVISSYISPSSKAHIYDSLCCRWAMALPKFVYCKVKSWMQTAKKVGEDDPRRIIHGVKVGFAIIAVSLLYYVNPLYENLGDAVMWAVMSVVVVFEYTVGATLGKGLNRMAATLLAGVSAVLVHNFCSNFIRWQIVGNTIMPLLFVFTVAVLFTFMRFIPKLKAKFDYGLMIFILTFSLISISSFGGRDAMDLASKRLVTIIMGSCIAVIVCICVCPVWNGVELDNLIAGNLDKLGCFLEQGFGGPYIEMILNEGNVKIDESTSSYMKKYKAVLDSTKSTEETMANLAGWEPCHGQYRFRHPWEQYLRVGNLTRQCAYKIDALTTYLLSSGIQERVSEIMSDLINEPCMKSISVESGKALRELSRGLKKTKIRASLSHQHISRSKSAAEELNRRMIQSAVKRLVIDQEDDQDRLMITNNLSDMVPVATVTALLVEITSCVEEIANTVCELASSAGFSVDGGDCTVVEPYCSDEEDDEYDDDTVNSDEIVQEIKLTRVACNNGDDHVIITVNDDESKLV